MRHRKAGVKLNRTSSHRKAMFRNMVTSLLKHERIRTTDVKAKELRSWADHLITLAKRGDLHARRQALSILREKNVVHKLFEEAPQRFGTIPGGYTRVLKIGRRRGDAAPMSMVELVDSSGITAKAPKKEKAVAAPPEAESEAVSDVQQVTAETAVPDDTGALEAESSEKEGEIVATGAEESTQEDSVSEGETASDAPQDAAAGSAEDTPEAEEPQETPESEDAPPEDKERPE